MAEINIPSSSKQKGVQRCKKLSTKVDLTPMVDLGFLLITFFIFTAALQQPKAFKLFMPANNTSTLPKMGGSKVLQVLLMDNNTIRYYFGNNSKQYSETNFSTTGIRQIIQQKQRLVKAKFGSITEMVMIIKPTTKSRYKNFVDIMDEVSINGVTRYVVTEASATEDNLTKTEL